MHILNVYQFYTFFDRGSETSKIGAISKFLRQNGHAVTILTVDYRKRWGTSEEELDGVRIAYLATAARYRVSTVNPEVLAFCLRRLREFDLVHIYGLYDLLGPVVAAFCRRWGIPYVVEPMGMFRPILSSIRLKQVYHYFLGKPLLEGARSIIATSEQERQELVEGGLPQAKVVVRRNGIALPELLPSSGSFRQQWGIPPDARVALFLGRLSPKKSPDLLIDAFAQSTTDSCLRDAVLVIAGPDEDGYRARLEAQAIALGVGGRVLFTGPLYDEAKWAAYRDATVFVLPSQNENFGNTVAEAVVCGTPVLVTDRCGIAPLIVGRAGLVVSYDPDAIRDGLHRLLTDHDLRQRFRTQADALRHELAWEEPVAQMEALYLRCIRGSL